MAGIIGNFGTNPKALSDLADGLGSRGPDVSMWRHGRLGLAIRAAVPTIHTCQGITAVVDGITETSRLLAGYAEHGPSALVQRGEPYAIAVADPKRDALLLARSGDGPGLYYIELDGDVLAAAEPGALFAAGAPATPDPDSVRRFVETGACDDGAATLYAGVRRVNPGEVVEITRSGVTVHAAADAGEETALSLPLAVQEAVRHGRVGVRLASGPEDAVLLAGVLAHPAACRPIPAYHSVLRGPQNEPGADPLGGDAKARDFAGGGAPASVRREVVEWSPAGFLAELPQFLADLGEPVPDLTGYLLWASVRASTGDSDVLLDCVGESHGHLARVADRLAARFGVAVRFPLVGQLATPSRFGSSECQRQASKQLGDLLLGIKDRVYAAFLTDDFSTRRWVNSSLALARFDQFVKGRGRHRAAWFWRLYLVEEWLSSLTGPPAVTPPAASAGFGAPAALAPHPGKDLETAVGGDRWLRFPVHTQRFVPGDPVAKKVAGHVAEVVTAARGDARYRHVFDTYWFVAVADKAVAVSQRRSYPVWEIRPGRWARALARLVSRTPYRGGPGSAWTLELAIREAGLGRVLAAMFASLLGRLFGRRDWFDRVAGPQAAAIGGPRGVVVSRRHAVLGGVTAPYPVSVPATLGAAEPDLVAAEVAEALRRALPKDAAANLAGCAVISAGELRQRVRGLHADQPAEFFEQAFADNPLGQGAEQTPVAVMVNAAAVVEPPPKPPVTTKPKRKPKPKAKRIPAVIP